jgi:hypothetical protein
MADDSVARRSHGLEHRGPTLYIGRDPGPVRVRVQVGQREIEVMVEDEGGG